MRFTVLLLLVAAVPSYASSLGRASSPPPPGQGLRPPTAARQEELLHIKMSTRTAEAATPGSSSRSLSRRGSTGSIKSNSTGTGGGGGGGGGGDKLRRRASFTTMAALSLAAVDPSTAFETLAAGANHACVITTTGGVKCWGGNSKGQLGYGDTEKRTAPSLDFVDLGDNRTAVSITAGDAHSCAVLDDGSLKCWGYGNYGQLGQGDTESHGSTTGSMAALPPVNLGMVTTTDVRKATKAAAGIEFTCVLTEDGQVGCFGRNDQGELGLGTEDAGDIGKVATDMGDNLEFIDFGDDYTGRAVDVTSGPCALFDDGSIKCWGNNLYGSTGVPGSVNIGLAEGDMGDALPAIPLGTGLSATLVASGGRHNCAAVGGGQVKCWGKNTQGNLGVGHVHDLGNDEDELGDNLDFTDLGAADAYRMDGGLDHTCALLEDGTVKCWGKNYNGALGLDDFRTRGDFPGEMGADLPPVNLGDNRTAVEVSCGDNFSCAVLDNGEVKCWGAGDDGKLGQGNSQQLGDSDGEMKELGAIDLGQGVLAATPVPPAFAPTGAPTAAPTASPTVSPAGIPPTPSPSAGAASQQPAAATAPSAGGGDGGSSQQPAASPSQQPAGSGSGSGSGSATTAPDAAAPTDGAETAGDRSASDSDGVDWNMTAVFIAAPIGAVALLAGGFAFYKKSRV